MASSLIQDLDDFVGYLDTTKISKKKKDKIIKVVDIVENAIEETEF